MKLKRIITTLLICCCFLSSASASDLTNVSITRVIQSNEQVYVFADVFNGQNGNSKSFTYNDNASVDIDNQSMPITSIQTVDAAGHGVHYVFVVDVSRIGSDSWGKAREGIKTCMSGLNSIDKVSLIVSSRSDIEALATAETNPEKALSALDTIKAPSENGNGKFYDAIKLAIDVANQTIDDPLMHRAIVAYLNVRISDQSTMLTADELSSRLCDEQIPLYVIAYGKDSARLVTLAKAARASGGTFFCAEKYKELPDYFVTTQRRIKSGYIVLIDTSQSTTDIHKKSMLLLTLGNINVGRDSTFNIAAMSTPTPEPTIDVTPTQTTKPTPSPTPQPYTQTPTPVASPSFEMVLPAERDYLPYLLLALIAVIFFATVVLIINLRKKHNTINSTINPPRDLGATMVSTNPNITVGNGTTVEEIAKTMSIQSAVGQNEDDPLTKTMKLDDILAKGILTTFTIKIDKPRSGNSIDAGSHQVFVLDDFTIGRKPDCSLCINDPTVGSKNAMMMSSMGKLLIRDLNSTNGTKVNGKVIKEPVELENGDVVQLGLTEITVNY